jgi:putative ABC transport system permease protein
MARIPGIRRWFRFPSSVERVSDEVETEIAFHVNERTQELIASGMDPAAARAAALREFGDVPGARAELEIIGRRRVRQTQRFDWWSDFRQDLRYGVRYLLHAPLFSLLAVVALALGVGANAAVFGVLKSALLDALPYADADRLVRVYGRWLDGSQERGPLSAGTIRDISERQRSFESLATFVDRTSDGVYGADDGSRVVKIAWAEPTLFETLGVQVTDGRPFQREDRASGLVPLSGGQLGPDTARGVLLTHRAWQRLFGGDSAVLGQNVRINGMPRTVIGVLPADFSGPMGDADFYFSFDLGPVVADPRFARASQWLALVGRLKPGVTHDAAQRELALIGADLAREHPQSDGSFALAATPLRDAMLGDTRGPLLVVMGSAVFVLLIACANLAGALLSRTLSRRKEFAVRLALGAGRGRLVRQLLTESMMLALAGGAAGVLLATFVLSMLRGLPLLALPDYVDLSLDGGAVLVTAFVAMCTGLAFGTLPALSIDGSNPQGALRDETRSVGESRRSRSLRGVLVAAQIALCLSLLTGAGLLARSLWAMTTTPLGFDADGVLTATVHLPSRDYPTPEARVRLREQFAERLRTLPGVDAVAEASMVPTAVRSRVSFTVAGAPPSKDAQPFVLYSVVSDDYFRTLRIPVRHGRTFDTQDRAGTPPTVVISESMARRYWPGGDAVGARIRIGPNSNSPLIEVIGIVGDVRNDRARPDAEPMAYRSSRQSAGPRAVFLLRTRTDPLALVRPVERELAELDAGLALERPTTLRALAGEGLAGRRLPVLLLAAFGALALLVASVGVYAMFSSMTATREREFGVRMALGSRPHAIAGLVLQQGAKWIVVGLAGGALGIVLVVRLVRDLLFEVSPFDPTVLGAAVVILVGCAAVALVVPVRRATRVDPMAALRAE